TQQLRVKSGATVADMRAIAIGAMQFATRVAELAESREVEITRELERQARMDAAKVAADRGVQDVLTATNAALGNEALVRPLIALANAGLATDAERQQLDALRDAALASLPTVGNGVSSQ